MSWVKIDDGFLDHPKFLSVGPVAGFLALCAVAWSNRNLTDGFIPARQVPRLANLEGIVDETNGSPNDYITAADLAAGLVEAGLWVPAEGGYQIHDYHQHQQSADQIRERRQKDSARKSEGRGQDSKRIPRGVRAESVALEVRSKKEEEEPPLSPPQGGRKRDRDAWEKTMLAWVRGLGIEGHDRALLWAVNGARPWESREAGEQRLRSFIADNPALGVSA